MSKPFRFFLLVLYGVGLGLFFGALWKAWPYYRLDLIERPHSLAHLDFRPGGRIGHALGILGSAMLLLLFLYSARKRELFGLRWGNLSRWLDIHIFFGIMGPLYITLHTSFKFNGIVSISYFAMMAVMLSGFFGRYIYMQIPRDEKGHVLSLQMALEREKQLERELRENFGLSDRVLQQIFTHFPERNGQLQLGLREMIWMDLVRPFRTFRLKKIIHREAPELSGRAFAVVINTIKQRNLLMRRRAFSRTAHKIFHYWHVIHKPFAIVMIVFMFIHIAITLMFGYGLQYR